MPGLALEELKSLLAGPHRRNLGMQMQYARMLADRQHGTELGRVLVRAAKLVSKPDVARFHLEAGRLLASAWQHAHAVRHFRLAGISREAGVAARVELAVSLERMHRLEEAGEALDRLPSSAVPLGLMARVRRRSGDAAGALGILSDLGTKERGMPPIDAAEAWHERHVILDAEGDYSAAWESLQRSKQAWQAAVGHERLNAWLASRRKTFDRVRAILPLVSAARIGRWMEGSSKARYLLIGAPRSGTTLLENLLEAHPQVIATDERDALAAAALEPLVAGFSLPPELPEGAFAETFARWLDDLPGARIEEMERQYLDELQEQMDCPLAGKWVLDKNPGLTESAFLVPRVLSRCRFLVALRDPRAVVWSSFQVFMRQPTEINIFWNDPAAAAEYYDHAMEIWWHLRQVMPRESWEEVRYEDLVRDPESEARRATGFLGLEWHERQSLPQDHVRAKLVRSPSYAQVMDAPHNRALEKWRNYERWLGAVYETLAPWVDRWEYSDP